MKVLIGRVVAVLRGKWARRIFVLAALAGAGWALATQWDEAQGAFGSITVGGLIASSAMSILYVVLTMFAWRSVLAGLGSRTPVPVSARIFFVSQVGKYLPGGVWNFIAAAELGAAHAIPRRRSMSGMVVSVLISIVTGLLLAGGAVAFGPTELRESFGWALWALPVFAVLLVPAVLNRVLDVLLLKSGRPPLEVPLSGGTVLRAAVWSVGAWGAAGTQVWVLATEVGMTATFETFALCVAGYALAWTVGFLFVIAPAGVGVREAVLAAALSGHIGPGEVVVVVLLSRLLLTAVDLLLGAGALALTRRSTRAEGLPT